MYVKLAVAGIIVVALAAGIYALLSRSHATVEMPPEIASLTVERPNLVVTGKGLAKVEVWVIPTGTNVSQADYTMLGEATLANTAVDGTQRWVLPIPAQPMSITNLYALGFDKTSGIPVGEVEYPKTGATVLYIALWGKASGTAATTSAIQ